MPFFAAAARNGTAMGTASTASGAGGGREGLLRDGIALPEAADDTGFREAPGGEVDAREGPFVGGMSAEADIGRPVPSVPATGGGLAFPGPTSVPAAGAAAPVVAPPAAAGAAGPVLGPNDRTNFIATPFEPVVLCAAAGRKLYPVLLPIPPAVVPPAGAWAGSWRYLH